MNMPTLTAEASLHRANGHYRTGRNKLLVNLPSQRVGPIHPAAQMRDEIIEIHGCAPGWTDYGGSCWPNPVTEPPPSWGGGGGGGNGGGPGRGGTGTIGDPASETGRGCQPGRENVFYNRRECNKCRKTCDIKFPLEPCEGSRIWCNVINKDQLGKRDRCYNDTCNLLCETCT
jgi:hypothetical protein